ncbi:hypothetical protein F5H01DRAFT_393710 [Linnemannia elongata]|nr:hypothetical protein F5H01DRAFT_393710 [Linnemannia elongata]
MRKKYTVLNGNRSDKIFVLFALFVSIRFLLVILLLNCSRLQELRLSAFVDSAWAKCLILANPGLRVLHWARNRKNISREELKDFASILSLQQLRYLGLDHWTYLTEYLYRTLAKNAGHLKELRLKRCDSILLKRSKRNDTGKSRYTVITSMETGVEGFKTLEQTCRRIRLAKLKTFHLDVEHNRCPLTLYWLIDIAPALETAVFRDLLGSTSKALGPTLRKSCPRLQTIKHGNDWEEKTLRLRQWGVTALHLLNACAPGHLVHASLRGLRLDNTFMEAFSVHRICLETLELDIRDDNYRDSFSNLGTILEQCSQRKHLPVAVPFYREPCARRQPLLFLDKLVTCPGLESLTLNGFRLAGENNHLHEGDEDYGSNEGTSRDSIEWDPEFEDYHDPQAYIFRPGWREVHLAFSSDDCTGWCSAHFKRLVGDVIGSLSSLKYVWFGIISYAQNATLNKAVGAVIRSCGIKGKWREEDEGVRPLFVAGDCNFTSKPGRPIRHFQFFKKLKTKLEALGFEIVSAEECSIKYSKSTIKNYAKFRLLNVDRRWNRNIKFILMMFDWIQKSAIFAYQRRLARSSTGGRLTRAEDMLYHSFGFEGLKFKSALFQKFSGLFDEFGSPQLFGTFSCDDKSAGQVVRPTFLPSRLTDVSRPDSRFEKPHHYYRVALRNTQTIAAHISCFVSTDETSYLGGFRVTIRGCLVAVQMPPDHLRTNYSESLGRP